MHAVEGDLRAVAAQHDDGVADRDGAGCQLENVRVFSSSRNTKNRGVKGIRTPLTFCMPCMPVSYDGVAQDPVYRRSEHLGRPAASRAGPPAKWRQTLVSTLGISALADIVDWDGLGLLWEARNVVAHRGGVVDARYHGKSNAEIGSLVASHPDSVRAAIDEIGAAASRSSPVSGTTCARGSALRSPSHLAYRSGPACEPGAGGRPSASPESRKPSLQPARR